MGFLDTMPDGKFFQINCYLGIFALLALWEFLAARRQQTIPRAKRWPHNLALTALNAVLLRLVFPGLGLGAAAWASSLNVGPFHWEEVPASFAVGFTIIVMDWGLYYQHRFLRDHPLFWKFHRLHHTDLEVDVTSAGRFHPGEVLFSVVVKSAIILALRAPVEGVFWFEVLWNASFLFNHANIRMPGWLEKILRILIVTPEMHRIHHSTLPAETNSNFGFLFSFWDRLLFTYCSQPKDGQEKMRLGLDVFTDRKYLGIGQLLMQPFQDKDGRFDWKNVTREK